MKTIKTTHIKTISNLKVKHVIRRTNKKSAKEDRDYYIAPSTMRGFFNYSI